MIKEGIYPNMTDEEYHAEDSVGIGSSTLVKFIDCPRSFWAASHYSPYEKKADEPEALFFGKAMHKYLLEPEDFYNVYSVMPCPKEIGALVTVADLCAYAKKHKIEAKGTKPQIEAAILEAKPDAPVWTKIKAEYENAERIPVTKEKQDIIVAMAEELKSERIQEGETSFMLGDIFENGEAEKAFFWEHPETGIMLKCKVDWLLAGIIFEYRTAANAAPRPFKYASMQRNYHIRAGIYWKIIKELTGSPPRFFYIAQEKKEPYLVGLYEQTQDDLAAAWSIAEQCLYGITECIKKGDPKDKNNWPSLTGGKVETLALDDYAFQPIQLNEVS